MADDIVTRLWNGDTSLGVPEIANEIERLRAALAIAAGMLSTREPYTDFHPEDILKMLIEEARRDNDLERGQP